MTGLAVRCYGCGQMYLPTEAATQMHTRHLGPPIVTRQQLATWLEQCQRERDHLARGYGAA